MMTPTSRNGKSVGNIYIYNIYIYIIYIYIDIIHTYIFLETNALRDTAFNIFHGVATSREGVVDLRSHQQTFLFKNKVAG